MISGWLARYSWGMASDSLFCHGRGIVTGGGLGLAVWLGLFLLGSGPQKRADTLDRPRINPKAFLRDVVFRSAALQRHMRYRVILPASGGPGVRFPAVYLPRNPIANRASAASHNS